MITAYIVDSNWWVVSVVYTHSPKEPIAYFKYEVEAQAYVENHNRHKQAGFLTKSLASLVESSSRPDLPVSREMLVGNPTPTPNGRAASSKISAIAFVM